MSAEDLAPARAAVALADDVVAAATRRLAGAGNLDEHQVLAYELAHAASAVEISRYLLDYGQHGPTEAAITNAFVADVVAQLAASLFGREADWGVEPGALDPTREFVAAHRSPAALSALAGAKVPNHLDEDYELVAETFRRFADDKVAPHAEHVHRHDADIPEEIIDGLAELGCFGLSVPEEYGGFATGTESDYMGMVIATEELSRASLGAGGSLITRPEILTRALEVGGTEEQKKTWFPTIATGETMVGVAVTEPDYGSDVASLSVTATPVEGGWVINGVKTWCTFAGRADVFMLLARTEPDRSLKHKGLSLFIVPKPRSSGHHFEHRQDNGGRIEGRAIPTLGYRGMHSFEVSFEDWFVPADNLIGGDTGRGRGFVYQMAGFENGRLQTAARAVGVMQAAYEQACDYAAERKVFGQSLADYQLTQAKLGRMAAIIAASRVYSYAVATMMASGGGSMEASMIKAYVCKAAEWVTREAMQIHGGFGYAEEYPVSRLFVDARVLSIFEGADETLCLKVIARSLVAQATA